MISSMSGMYPTTVICLSLVRDFLCVAYRFWLPCHIFKQSWSVGILYNFLSSASCCTTKLFSGFVVSETGQSPAKITVLARANCLTTTFSELVLPAVVDSLQPTTSHPREHLTPLGHHMVRYIICGVTHCRAWHTLSTFPLAVTTSWLYLVSKMYFKSLLSRSSNH